MDSWRSDVLSAHKLIVRSGDHLTECLRGSGRVEPWLSELARGSEAASAPPSVEEREREGKSTGCPMTPSPILPTCRSEWSGETSSSRSGETHIANECDEGESHCDDARLVMSKNMTQFREPASPMPPNELVRVDLTRESWRTRSGRALLLFSRCAGPEPPHGYQCWLERRGCSARRVTWIDVPWSRHDRIPSASLALGYTVHSYTVPVHTDTSKKP